MNDHARTPALSRRVFTKAIAGLAVVGYHAGAGSWVVSADGPPESAFDKIPKLDGTLLLDEATREGTPRTSGRS